LTSFEDGVGATLTFLGQFFFGFLSGYGYLVMNDESTTAFFVILWFLCTLAFGGLCYRQGQESEKR